MPDDPKKFPIFRHDETDTRKESDLMGGMFRAELAETRRIAIGKKGDKWLESERGRKYRPPQKLDYFLITLLEQTETGDFVRDEATHKVIGDKPRTVPITFLYDRPGLNVHPYLGLYAGRTAWCKGDGTKALRLDKETMERRPIACPCDLLTAGKCKPHIVLQARLPTQPMGEIAKFRSTSKHTISYILGGMARIMEATAEFFNLPRHQGILAKIPLNLNLHKKTVNAKDGQVHTIPVVSVTYNGTEEELERYAQARMRRYKGVVNYLQDLEDLKKIERAEQANVLKPETPEIVGRITEEFHPGQIDEVKDISQIPTPKDQPRLLDKKDVAEFEDKLQAADDLLEEGDIAPGMKGALEQSEEDLLGEDPDGQRPQPRERRVQKPKPKGDDEPWV